MKPFRCINCSAVVNKYKITDFPINESKWMDLQLPGESVNNSYRPCICNDCRQEVPRVVLSMFEHYSRMLVMVSAIFGGASDFMTYQSDKEGGDEPCESGTEQEGRYPADILGEGGSSNQQREGGSDASTD